MQPGKRDAESCRRVADAFTPDLSRDFDVGFYGKNLCGQPEMVLRWPTCSRASLWTALGCLLVGGVAAWVYPDRMGWLFPLFPLFSLLWCFYFGWRSRAFNLTPSGLRIFQLRRPWLSRRKNPIRVWMDFYPDGLYGPEYRVFLENADGGLFVSPDGDLYSEPLAPWRMGLFLATWFDVPLDAHGMGGACPEELAGRLDDLAAALGEDPRKRIRFDPGDDSAARETAKAPCPPADKKIE